MAAISIAERVEMRRKLIIIGAVMALSAPVFSQGYKGPSASEIEDAVSDGISDSASTIQDAVRDGVGDGILAAEEARQEGMEYQRAMQEKRDRCKAHPSWACQ